MWILNGCTMDTFINYPWFYEKNRVRKYLETHKFIPNTYIMLSVMQVSMSPCINGLTRQIVIPHKV